MPTYFFRNLYCFFIIGITPLFSLEGQGCFSEGDLFKDLELVERVNKEIHDHLPHLVNYQLQGGYFTMPSARTFDTGVLSAGFSYVPPYHIWSLGFQFFDHIETTGNYWVYKGMLDEVFGHMGFGDSADRAADIKFIFLKREDGFRFVPNVAIGWNDFLGSKRFKSFYVVLTKEFLESNLELTLGWGSGRIKGFYGGGAWSPFRKGSSFLKNLSLVGEYDANDYKHHAHEHPSGRKVDSRLNLGLQYAFKDWLRLSGSTLRGKDLAGSISLQYNLGESKGLVPKIYDPPLYTAPVDTEPLGPIRKRKELASDFAYAFQEQGLDLYRLYLVPDSSTRLGSTQDLLWMKVINVRYREEEEVRRRIQLVLGALTPSNIAKVVVVTEADGILNQEYRFRTEDLRRYFQQKIGGDEMRVISPPKEVSKLPGVYDSAELYRRNHPIWVLTFRPWFRSFLGSSKGKFKYETGISLNQEGYFFNQIYYNLLATYTAKSSTSNLKSHDILNPSRLIQVRSDSILYNQSNSFHLAQAYFQKSWNFGKGWFGRVGLGYFEAAYGGLALEALYYPVQTNWAIGFEAATVLKRSYYGIGVETKARKLTDEGLIEVPYVGVQYFIDFYYQYRPMNLDFKVHVGQFLARDKGARFEGGRTFASGLRVGLWYTLTNAEDRVNGDRYYDKGFSITMPLDFFLNKSSRTRIGYAMSAWLRDCGAIAATGKTLYPTLFWDRYNPKPVFY